MDVSVPPDQIWMVVIGFIIAFILAFGIGANDVANSFGTSVGAKVLTLRQACILASLFETLGAVLLGAKVSDTIRKGIIDISPYQNETELLMVGNVAALAGSGIWLVSATLLRLPVSATHSIVGATVGFALVAHGAKGINWRKLGMIVGSWFVSPALAGMVSTGIFYFIKFFILRKDDALEHGLRFLPIFYALTVVVNLFSVFYDGPEMLGFDKIPLWGTFILSFGTGIIVAIIVRLIVVPWQRRVITKKCKEPSPQTSENPLNQNNDTCNGEQKLSPDKVAIQNEEDQRYYSDLSPSSVSVVTKEKNAVQPTEDKGTDRVVLHTMAEMEKKENHRNTKHAATNFCHPAHPPLTGTILTDITVPAQKKPIEKHAGKISKAEDAPLMDNEYKLGSVTPINKSPTATDLGNLENNVTAINGQLVVGKTDIKTTSANNLSGQNLDEADEDSDTDDKFAGRKFIKDKPETARLFSFLQILTAVFGAFAHGGNDVSNAIGPLVSLWLVATTGMVEGKAQTPIWILAYGGVGISIGLFVWGRRVIKTMGEDLTKITPSSGFCIEIGSALTVLIASNIGIPISTTHCKVGSIVLVGQFRSRENVDWSIFRNIVLAWLVTLPITGGISAAIMAGLQLLV